MFLTQTMRSLLVLLTMQTAAWAQGRAVSAPVSAPAAAAPVAPPVVPDLTLFFGLSGLRLSPGPFGIPLTPAPQSVPPAPLAAPKPAAAAAKAAPAVRAARTKAAKTAPAAAKEEGAGTLSSLGALEETGRKQGEDDSRDRSGESLSAEASRRFDGTAAREEAAPAVAADAPREAGSWRNALFASPAGGDIRYRFRMPERSQGRVPTVFVGGLALAESFEPYFQTEPARAGQFVLWLRGLAPTELGPRTQMLDADTRDLARLIVTAARESGSERVDLALHSYSTLLFQRMLALHEDPEVAAALKLLRGAHVSAITGSTHYDHTEYDVGLEFVFRKKLAEAIVSMQDMRDGMSKLLWSMSRWNPFLLPMAYSFEFYNRLKELMILRASGKSIADQLKTHLKDPWAPDIDPIRLKLLAQLEEAWRQKEWQKASLLRTVDMHALEFTPQDVQRLRALGIRLDVIIAKDDQVLPWALQRDLLARFGIETPKETPPPGTVYADREGTVRAQVVDSDHYFPLREPGQLKEILEGQR
ncbi:MAG: hypothetical protein WC969_10015 [Elusimicrobiota bacterium]|jgi:hypothetical protein